MWGRWSYDVVAFLALIVAVATGLVPAEASFSGFGHPATITVAFVLIISRTLASAGAVDWAATLIRPAAKRTSTHIAALSSLAAALSGFMNNVGTLGLLMPVALQSARKAGRSAALILMPLSFGSILGGLITLIGTPPNIIIASYRGLTAGEPFGMFDFTPVGAVAAIAGLAFVALIGWRLVPRAAAERAATEELFDIENYLTEVRVTEDSKALGKTLVEIRKENQDIDALRAPGVTLWSAWEGATLVGCGALKHLDPQTGELKSMRTVDGHRRKGVASKILAHLIHEARARGYRELYLETGAQDAFAGVRVFYQRHGFRGRGPFGDYAPDPNSVFMTLAL